MQASASLCGFLADVPQPALLRSLRAEQTDDFLFSNRITKKY